MSIYQQIATKIIKEQQLIIGPLALSESKKVNGLTVVNSKPIEVQIEGNEQEVINRLVAQYERLFGRASHEVCREAVSRIIADINPEEVPTSLR